MKKLTLFKALVLFNISVTTLLVVSYIVNTEYNVFQVFKQSVTQSYLGSNCSVSNDDNETIIECKKP